MHIYISNIVLEPTPDPEPTLYEGIPYLFLGVWGCFGYAPGVCWDSLRYVYVYIYIYTYMHIIYYIYASMWLTHPTTLTQSGMVWQIADLGGFEEWRDDVNLPFKIESFNRMDCHRWNATWKKFWSFLNPINPWGFSWKMVKCFKGI